MKKIFRSLVRRVMYLIFKVIEKINLKFSKVGEGPFFENDKFPWVHEVESQYEEILKEFHDVLNSEMIPPFQDISPHQEALTQDDRWQTFFLYAYGYKSERNCIKCPKTTEALEKIPGLITAMFSILTTEKHIPPHRGLYNGVLRYHLALQVPDDGKECGITVGGETRHWTEGESMVFDDTYMHEAWNKTSKLRAVLFLDITRPLPWVFDRLNKSIIYMIGKTPFVTIGKKNLEEWNRKTDENTLTS